jgi:hypothetical protein
MDSDEPGCLLCRIGLQGDLIVTQIMLLGYSIIIRREHLIGGLNPSCSGQNERSLTQYIFIGEVRQNLGWTGTSPVATSCALTCTKYGGVVLGAVFVPAPTTPEQRGVLENSYYCITTSVCHYG